MPGMWGKLWFRIMAAIVASPVIMTGAMILAMMVIVPLTRHGAMFAMAEVVPPPNTFLFLVPAQYVMLLPVMIAAEIGNRRHVRPLPPYICALFLAVLTLAFMGALVAAIEVFQSGRMVGGVLVGVTLLAGCYAAALAVSLALVSPLILRWHKDSRTAGDVAGMF